MYADYRKLTNDENFWKTEEEIAKFAREHIRELGKIKPFDFFKLAPQTYDIRGNKDAEAGDGKKAAKTAVPEPGTNVQSGAPKSKIVINPNDDSKPKEDREQVNNMTLALNAINAELGSQGVNINRGPETEIGYQKEVEELMSELSKHKINIPNKILQRALVLPKDKQDQQSKVYPQILSQL